MGKSGPKPAIFGKGTFATVEVCLQILEAGGKIELNLGIKKAFVLDVVGNSKQLRSLTYQVLITGNKQLQMSRFKNKNEETIIQWTKRRLIK